MRPLCAVALCAVLAGCLSAAGGPERRYLGIETSLLDAELVNIVARLDGGTGDDLADYARCAAAQYTLRRGFAFARHVRTSVGSEAGIRIADAVYTMSSALPRGARTLDAEVIVADCRARGIPTV